MKKIKSLSFILLSAMLVSCGKISVSPDSAISASSEVSDSTEESDELLGSEESSLTEESTSTEPSDSFSEIVSDSVSDSTSEEDPDDEDEPEVDYREEDYSYHPSSPETIPSISISSDTGNDFVTVPNKDNKWDYTDCRISVSHCLEEYQLSDIEAGVKVRGNYTANYEKKP